MTTPTRVDGARRGRLSIGIACSSRELFGADRSAVRLASVLQRLGHQPVLLLPTDRPERGLQDFAEQSGVRTRETSITIATSRGLEGVRSRFTTRRARFDLLIVNSTAVLAVGARANKTVTVVREWLLESDVRHRAVTRVHARRSDHIVAISRGVADQWNALSKSSLPVSVIPNWLEDTVIEAASPESGVGILCVGRFNRWKGQAVLADAYENALPSFGNEPPPLTFLGAEEDGLHGAIAAELRARGEDLGHWSVQPFVTDPTPVLAESAVLVVPSLRPEPFGMVILEALNQGCRVIAFEGAGPTDLAESFPGVVTTVPRGDDSLAGSLEAWHRTGAAGQSSDEMARVRETLRTRYSTRAAEGAWTTCLADLGVA